MTNSQIIITCVAAFCLVVICALFTVMIIRYKRATSEAITKGADDPALVAKALRCSKNQRIFIRILSGLWKGAWSCENQQPRETRRGAGRKGGFWRNSGKNSVTSLVSPGIL